MNLEFVFSWIGKSVRALPLAGGAGWIIYRDQSSSMDSMLVSSICIIAAMIFILTAICLMLSGDQAENLY